MSRPDATALSDVVPTDDLLHVDLPFRVVCWLADCQRVWVPDENIINFSFHSLFMSFHFAQEGDVQPPDQLAGGRAPARQQQHDDHADREQE